MASVVQPFHERIQYRLEDNNPLIVNKKHIEFLQGLVDSLGDTAVRKITQHNNTTEKQISELTDHMGSLQKMKCLVETVVLKHLQQNQQVKTEFFSFSRGVNVLLTPLIRPFWDRLDMAAKDRLSLLPERQVPLDIDYPPVCRMAIETTYNIPNLEWVIDKLPVKYRERQFIKQENAQDAFTRCLIREKTVDQLRDEMASGEAVQTSCDGYIQLTLLLMSDDPESVLSVFRDRLERCCSTMQEVVNGRGADLNKRLNQMFYQTFYPSLEQAEEISDISNIEPGNILIFSLREHESYEFLHMVFSFDPGRGIGLWHYPLDPLSGKSLKGAQIMEIQQTVKVLADDFGRDPEEIVVKKISIDTFMQR